MIELPSSTETGLLLQMQLSNCPYCNKEFDEIRLDRFVCTVEGDHEFFILNEENCWYLDLYKDGFTIGKDTKDYYISYLDINDIYSAHVQPSIIIDYIDLQDVFTIINRYKKLLIFS